ncbi:PQQ-binding-like beta-propeller repeat protein [Actinoplanes sp. Pm04-4]|uniref:PQQ-binding-like beta-propeller repeat protein n=1 Tax=Paractinoplanes pyxinae TaxID=2997416 RepID=A0ABT4B2D7_9ACTN|nr:PQQ-binding-like beta-propeller repeat protein [Actinoplanes pyxinae]MCY1140232.1 PQQ-binding-like beta-propeller repeat protein [Actinoplanes pyxinae]
MIELDLTAQPDPTLTAPPPAHRYRGPALVLVAVLVLAAGGAAPVMPMLWRYLGSVPSPAGAESPFQLTGGRVYTVAVTGFEREITAWSIAEHPRELWRNHLRTPPADPDDMGWGGLDAQPAGDLVLFSYRNITAVVDARSGATRWRSPANITPLPGGRVGLVQSQDFRPGTVYDQASGDPGMLYFSSTGEPHTEPPRRTDVRGVDLGTGRTLWTVSARGAVSVTVAPGEDPAVLMLSSDRLRRIDGVTGAVLRDTALPPVDGAGPSGGSLVDGLLAVAYGKDGVVTEEVAYSADTVERRWSRPVPRTMSDPASCSGLFCTSERRTLDVLDPDTGQARWRAPDDVDLSRHGRYVIEWSSDSGLPMRLVDPATGATRVDLGGWQNELLGRSDQPLVLRRGGEVGASTFAVVLPRHDAIQPLGGTGGPVSDCSSDERHVVCRSGDELRIWAYRA